MTWREAQKRRRVVRRQCGDTAALPRAQARPEGSVCAAGGAAAGDVDRRLSPCTYVGAERSEQCFRQVP